MPSRLCLDGDFDKQGRVKTSYPSHDYNTARVAWDLMLPLMTNEYAHGGLNATIGDPT